MTQEKHWKNYFEKAWEIQKKRKTSQLSLRELKQIALESGMTESDWNAVQKAFQDYIQRGKSYLKHKNWKDAIEELEEAYKINAYDAELLLLLARSYKEKYFARKWMGSAKRAISYAEACLEINPAQKEASGIVTNLRSGLNKQRKNLLIRVLSLTILTAAVSVVVYFWQPIQKELKTDWAKVKEYFVNTTQNKGNSFVLQDVTFSLGKSTLDEASKKELNRLVEYLKAHSKVRGEIAGHTDNTGNKEANQFISEQRAKVVYIYLVKAGIASERLEYKGYGDQYPKVPNIDEASKAKNRRIEFKIL